MSRYRRSRRISKSGSRRHRHALWCSLLLAVAALPGGLAAQVTASSDLTGSAADEFGSPLPNALVSLFRDGHRVGGEVSTGRDGRFALTGLAPGRYDLRVEALGFHPVVVRGIAARPGARIDVPVRLRVGRPPVTEVDTVRATAGGLEFDRWLESLELDAPSDSRDLRQGLTLVTTLDEGLGSLGLPSGFTSFTIQGVPFRGAAVAPLSQDPDAALTAGSAGLVRVAPLGVSRGFGMNSGGEVEVFNPSLASGEAEVFAHGSAGALWMGEFDMPEGLSPVSYWAGGRSGVDLVPDSLRLVVGAEFHHVERPRLGLFPEGPLSESEVESSERVAAYLLTDWNFGGGTRVDLGARFGARPAVDSRSGLAYPRGASAQEARDILVGAGLVSDIGQRASLGIRVGYTRSQRTGSLDAWALDAGAPLLLQASSGLRGGIAPLGLRETVRDGIFGSASVGFDLGNHTLETGLEILRSGHEIDPLEGSTIRVGGGDPFSDGWAGIASRYENTLGARDFGVTHFSAFLRDSWRPVPGVQLELGARWHQERLPIEDLRFSQEWIGLSGLEPPDPQPDGDGFGTHVGVDWFGGGGNLRLSGVVGVTVDETDPWLVAEALALDGDSQHRIVHLDGPDAPPWPAFPADAEEARVSPSLVLLPETRALPTSFFAGAGLSTRVAGLVFGARGTFRRTENLTRRSDINRLPVPSGSTADGREVWGVPTALGSLVAAEPGSFRRFQSFDHVWAVVQDGWSQYVGLTLSVERREAGNIQLAGWYTLSATTDNLPGLAQRRPELAGTSGASEDDDWSEGTSDLDVPHRIGAAVAIPFPFLAGGAIRGRMRARSGRAFTPGYRPGVDLNADGIENNDPAWIPSEGVADLGTEWDCVLESRGTYIERNGCRTPWVSYLDVGLSLGLVEFGGATLSFEVDALNVLDARDGPTDEALFLVDGSAGLQADGTTWSPSLTVNPGLGEELVNLGDGRMLRLGLRWGGGR